MSCSSWMKVKDNACRGTSTRDKQRPHHLPNYAMQLHQWCDTDASYVEDKALNIVVENV